MKRLLVLLILFLIVGLVGCEGLPDSQETKDARAVQKQQSQYAASQPVPAFNWSLERHLVTQLYQIRNQRALTHSVWRSDRGMIEGDCASVGFGLPYDTSLTNPLRTTDEDQTGNRNSALAVIEQSEPNGIFASKNTAATWVMCAGDAGMIEPVYVETKVTVYPYPVSVDYKNNRVRKAGDSSVKIKTTK